VRDPDWYRDVPLPRPPQVDKLNELPLWVAIGLVVMGFSSWVVTYEYGKYEGQRRGYILGCKESGRDVIEVNENELRCVETTP
jgi:hypothetical protein